MSETSSDDTTLLCHAGNRPETHHGIINPPVYHASTVLFPTVAALEASLEDRFAHVHYGRYGTPTTFAFEEAVAALEGGDKAMALPSGLAAINVALMSFLHSGDHILVTDSVYDPVRSLCDRLLSRFGIATTYYDPLIGAGIADLIRPNTRIVYLESPGSLSFDIQDVPAIAAVAHDSGALVMLDNTWATPLFYKPLRHGVDIVIHAATKYSAGHSDAMLGVVVAPQAQWRAMKICGHGMGFAAAPDDCYLALRGLRTLDVRLRRHEANGLALARWLAGRPEVARLLHPALPGDPGHELWRRDFTGASGLFGVVLKPCPLAALHAMLDGMKLFGMGFSWGGYESLILPVNLTTRRGAMRGEEGGPTLRIHAGLESVAELIADLEAGFARLAAARG